MAGRNQQSRAIAHGKGTGQGRVPIRLKKDDQVKVIAGRDKNGALSLFTIRMVYHLSAPAPEIPEARETLIDQSEIARRVAVALSTTARIATISPRCA